MSIANVVHTTSKIVSSIYRILVTSILGYHLVRETIQKERERKKR